MIFATDLDNTMIYSSNRISENDFPNLELVERTQNNINTYMSKKAIEELKKLNEKILVIPTTTRAKFEFDNINYFKFCKYAVVTNGGTILYNGQPLQDWENHIEKILKPHNDEINLIIETLQKQDFLGTEIKLFDGKYIFSRVINIEKCINFLNNFIDKTVWNYTIQGKKLYIIHKEITKSNALKYLLKRVNSRTLIASGDSIMDKDMLDISDYCIIPKHGRLYKDYNYSKENTFYVKEGVFAADEIINKVNEIVEMGKFEK